MTLQIHAVTFAPDHLAVQYIDLPTDVRDDGRVALTHQVQLYASHPDYREAIRKIHDRVVALVEDGLENWHETDPYEPVDPEDDDDDRGLGD